MRHSKFQRSSHSSKSIPAGLAVAIVGLLFIAVASAITLFTANGPATIHREWNEAVKLGKSLRHPPRWHGPVIYAYSIIPGGVHSLAELERAIARDPVVAAQYANFDLAKFCIVKLKKDEYAYVSYRIGGDVFWTKRKLKLCRGETVVTDGEHYFRTRCGNQVSEVPQATTWSEEPSYDALNTPATPSGEPQTEAFAAVLPGPSATGNSFTLGGPIQFPPSNGVTTSTPPPGIPFIPLIPPPSGCGKDGCKQTIPPPSPVPENSNFVLLGSGILVLAICMLRRRKVALALKGRA